MRTNQRCALYRAHRYISWHGASLEASAQTVGVPCMDGALGASTTPAVKANVATTTATASAATSTATANVSRARTSRVPSAAAGSRLQRPQDAVRVVRERQIEEAPSSTRGACRQPEQRFEAARADRRVRELQCTRASAWPHIAQRRRSFVTHEVGAERELVKRAD